ncbi:hypothetical protein Tco_0360070 [Tanacetum coccineum]
MIGIPPLSYTCPVDLTYNLLYALCARYQARQPTISTINAVKGSLVSKGNRHRGFWYPKGFFLFTARSSAFADADHAGWQDTRRRVHWQYYNFWVIDLLLWMMHWWLLLTTLKIGKCNLRLSSDVTSKEATLQVVYDVLKLTPFYKAFQVTADAPEIYMQEFWASAYVHNRSVRFKMNNKKHIIGLDQFRDILQICPKVGNKKFVEPPLEKEILIFLASLGHSGDIRKITDRNLTEAEQLKIITKRSHQETHSSHASGSGADEGTGVTPGVPDAPDYDLEDDISWKSSDDDQADEQAEDDEDAGKNDVNETTQDDEDDDDYDDDEKVQDADEHDVDKTVQEDDDEEQTESDDDGDDFVHPKLTTHDDEIIHEEDTDEDDSSISSSDEENSDNDVEGTNVEGAKMDEEATYEEDQGNEAVKDTNTDLDGRDKVMTDVEDTHVTLTPVNPDGQQQSSSVSSGFVSNMLNPNQDTGVDDIFRQHTEATSLIDTSVTAIMEPSFTAQINRPPTPHPIVIQTQQPPILTPATTTSSSLQNLPNFASLFGFDYRLKALEDNFSELRQTNQYAEALSSIPSTVEQYLANKMQEAVDVAVQLKYERIREESTTANQQFLDSIDDGMKKIIKEQVKKEVSKIIPKVEKFVTDRLESEVLVRSSKEANTSHAVAANLSELELKKILIDKMEANNSINRSDIQRQLYKDLVEAYEADKILLDTYGDTVTIKRPRDGADDDEEPSAGTDRGSKRRRSGKEPASTSAPSETTTKTAGKTTSTGSKTHKKSASQSAPSKLNKRERGKVSNLSVIEERIAFNVPYCLFTRRVVISDVCYKAVRLRFSDPMIQPEPEGSTQGYPLVSVDVLRTSEWNIHSHIEDGILLESTSNKLMVGSHPQGLEGYIQQSWHECKTYSSPCFIVRFYAGYVKSVVERFMIPAGFPSMSGPDCRKFHKMARIIRWRRDCGLVDDSQERQDRYNAKGLWIKHRNARCKSVK